MNLSPVRKLIDDLNSYFRKILCFSLFTISSELSKCKKSPYFSYSNGYSMKFFNNFKNNLAFKNKNN